MRLRLKSNVQRYASDRQIRIEQQFLRVGDAAPEEVFMWGQTRTGAELRREVHASQADRVGHAPECDRRVESGLDIVGDPVEPPRCQRTLALGTVSQNQGASPSAGTLWRG